MPTIFSETYEQSVVCFLRRFRLAPIVLSFFLVLFTIFFVRDLAQRGVLGATKRQLPYPGMLPDNPLYGVKEMRDDFILLTTRQPLQKASLYLHLADKTANAVTMLNSCSLAAKTAVDSQKYLNNQKEALLEAKEIGLAPEISMIEGNKFSFRAHKRILISLDKRCTGKPEQQLISQAFTLHDSFARWFFSAYPTL